MEEQIDYVERFYALDDAIFKSLGNMIWVSMPESVQQGRSVRRWCVPQFFPSQRHHDVCCMMTAEEQVDYVSTDVIHEILTTEPLREKFWSRVELELEHEGDIVELKKLLSKCGSGNTYPDEEWVLQNLGKITDHAKYLYNTYQNSE